MGFHKLITRYKQFGGAKLVWQYAKLGAVPTVLKGLWRFTVKGSWQLWFIVHGSWLMIMTQDERWNKRYQDVMDFMEKNHRNPSRHRLKEHDMLNWVKPQRKLKNKGELKAERVEMLERLLSLWEEYKHVNQYK